MAKVSKNARAGQRAQNSGGKDWVKVVKPVKDAATGKYSFQEVMIHKDEVTKFFNS
ncbi:MAG TPA: DUF4295 family protein [Saprospiraceae bacterium]|nr:DUF4295 family protein [Saprospiraceae bacterium]MCB9269606.1 DUF4295 family protein [Lewinellaceae bacterium]HPG06082.1 DUF4295 family protein [Saprospiraceae bacterium]HPR00831.1 DUF4295 family protein [Saprospiraceae bacterium]HRV84065.1 DUF4295 family protein [Saprospiraceae bacterium]